MATTTCIICGNNIEHTIETRIICRTGDCRKIWHKMKYYYKRTVLLKQKCKNPLTFEEAEIFKRLIKNDLLNKYSYRSQVM
jgi:hypothetical protein